MSGLVKILHMMENEIWWKGKVKNIKGMNRRNLLIQRLGYPFWRVHNRMSHGCSSENVSFNRTIGKDAKKIKENEREKRFRQDLRRSAKLDSISSCFCKEHLEVKLLHYADVWYVPERIVETMRLYSSYFFLEKPGTGSVFCDVRLEKSFACRSNGDFVSSVNNNKLPWIILRFSKCF